MPQRDYTTISPSARGLLLMKSLTNIPFIRQAAVSMFGPATTNAAKARLAEPTFLPRLIHFEQRYWSIDEVLGHYPVNNILEISSGFSFRGLSMASQNPNLTYIDTDLPEVIGNKLAIVDDIITENKIETTGNLYIQPLNTLDEAAFNKLIDQFPPGPVAILNEGLLVYLEPEEKARLCQIVKSILKRRGGCWITGDVYIRKQFAPEKPDAFSDFLKSHDVERKKFESFEEAEAFFNQQGLRIDRAAGSVRDKLSALKYVDPKALENLGREQMNKIRIRQTWALVPTE